MSSIYTVTRHVSLHEVTPEYLRGAPDNTFQLHRKGVPILATHDNKSYETIRRKDWLLELDDDILVYLFEDPFDPDEFDGVGDDYRDNYLVLYSSKKGKLGIHRFEETSDPSYPAREWKEGSSRSPAVALLLSTGENCYRYGPFQIAITPGMIKVVGPDCQITVVHHRAEVVFPSDQLSIEFARKEVDDVITIKDPTEGLTIPIIPWNDRLEEVIDSLR